nr:DNA internalization-related competence protein ComEC/Rec2 [uncultured Vibrio sp.]
MTAGWYGLAVAPPLLTSVSVSLLLFPMAAIFLPSAARMLLTLPFFFLLGLAHTLPSLQPPTNPDHIFQHIPDKTQGTVIGTILTMPEYTGQTTRFTLDCQSLLKAGTPFPAAFQPVRGRLQCTLQGQLPPSLKAGSTIMAIATIDRLHRYQSPGAFNFPLVMATKKIYCTAWIQSASALEPIYESQNTATLLGLLHKSRHLPQQARQHMAAFVDKTLAPEQASLYQALLIGSLKNIPPATLEAFKHSGVFHLLAISGLHFSLLGLFTYGLLLFVLKRSQWLLIHTHVPTLALLLTAPLLLSYALVAGMNLPALRAVITALLALTAVLFRRQRSLLPLIAAAALLILALNPPALFTASFQLSFAAVLSINLIFPRLPVFALQRETATRWSTFVDKGWRTGQSMLLVSLAATAGTLPILLAHFNRVSLIGPAMNLVIEPLLCLWALPWGLIAFPLSWWAPDLAAACLHVGELGLTTSLWLIKSIQNVPGLSLWTITPTAVEIVFYYAVLFLLMQAPVFPHRRGTALALDFILAGSLLTSLWNPWPNPCLAVHFLDVGQGTSTLIQGPRGHNILIDGGGYQSDRFNTGEDIIAPFLWHRRLWKLDTLVITHPHGDHYNGLFFILDHFKPRRVIINGDDGEETAYQHLLTKVSNLHIPVEYAQAGAIVSRESDFSLRCLGMPGLPEQSRWETNDRSLVFRLDHGDHSFLFPADIGKPSEQVLLKSEAYLHATVLLAPHHGSRGSASKDFIKTVDPAMIVVSSGRNRLGVLPAPEHLEHWKTENISTLMTARDGTITLESEGKRLYARTFTGKRMDYSRQTKEFQQQKSDLKGRINRGMLDN